MFVFIVIFSESVRHNLANHEEGMTHLLELEEAQ